ncbi:MAG: hypothetical protein M3Q19_09265 [Pseudomonadota bacterium]|nr:hypothetical protein [Pseudomonadota bacterium]
MIEVEQFNLKCRLRMVSMHPADWRGAVASTKANSAGVMVRLRCLEKFAEAAPLV